MDGGKIIERGAYQDLLTRGGAFAELIDEFGTDERNQGAQAVVKPDDAEKKADTQLKPAGAGAQKLIEGDERETGAVSWSAYGNYLKAAGGLKWAPLLLMWLGLAQCAQVASNIFLGFWTDLGVPGFSSGQYMGVYACVRYAAPDNVLKSTSSADWALRRPCSPSSAHSRSRSLVSMRR